MNNDSTPIEPSASTTNTNPTSDNNNNNNNNEPSVDAAPATAEASVVVQSPAQERAKLRTRKRGEFIGDLMSKMDVIIYVELVQLYYMDCSLFRFLLRLIPQWLFLTPKPASVPQHKPYLGGIIIPNICCILLHILTARPTAGEAMRFYLHGGVIPDFIGQKSPSSKIVLVGLDMLVLVLQCVMLAVHVQREQLKEILKASGGPISISTGTGEGSTPRAHVVTVQDHDAEERGVIRDEVTTMNDGDIELQPLVPRNLESPGANLSDLDSERNEERERLLAEPVPRPEDSDENSHALDVFYSGEAVIAELHVLHTLRALWNDYGGAADGAIQTVGFSAGFAAVTANQVNRRLGVRF